MSHPPLRPPATKPDIVHGIVTVAPQMQEVFARLRRVARTDATVLLRGESGTGKELFARALHKCSPRANGPFRAVNCATLTGELLASELFGHVRGAFTGAVRDKPGLFELAHTGTIFLDEVAELPMDIQARLLRVLQERTFVPVGGTSPREVDVRVVSATNKALREEVERGRFREDLMYRIRVAVLFLPRLVDRTGDIEALVWHFIEEFNVAGYRHIEAVAVDAMEAMLAYPWPGNIRELRNNLEQAFAMGEGPVLVLEDLAPELQGLGPYGSADGGIRGAPLPTAPVPHLTEDDLERERLIDALRQAKGRKSEAAEILGMSRSTLWRKLKRHGISR